ncbi:hypothetical protein ACFWTC_14365 [Streptomyces sp. NPDC058619]|uniref:hypothetical protein n=1 Tax=Streptomyces sp. NPDC058619 TaxID=3346559 RepID=UPI0036690F1C
MMARPAYTPQPSASFRDDEPVFGHSHQVLEGSISPVFGDLHFWAGDCIDRPANRARGAWKINLPARDWRLNLLLREVAFSLLNPTHPVLRRMGVFLLAEPAAFGTVIATCRKLQVIWRWGRKQGLGQDLGGWDPQEWQSFIESQAAELGWRTVATYINAIRKLQSVAAVVTDTTPFEDPWGDEPAVHIAKRAVEACLGSVSDSDGLSTETIAPETWWPLQRAAWSYIHTFAPDVLDWRDAFERELAQLPQPPIVHRQPSVSADDLDDQVKRWLAEPENRVPVHAREWRGAPEGSPMWLTLSKMITGGANMHLFALRRGFLPARVGARRAAVLKVVAQGRVEAVYGAKAGSHMGAPAYQPKDKGQRLSARDLDDTLRNWLADPGNKVPIRAADDRYGKAGTPIVSMLTRLVWGKARGTKVDRRATTSRARVELIENAVAAGQVIALDSTGNRAGWQSRVMACPGAATVVLADGGSRPWRTEISQSDLQDELRMVRAACYVFIGAMSMMRDSEVQEIERSSLTTHFGSPAVASRKTKKDPTRPELLWWIIEPVAEAIAVAERLSWHPTHLFVPLDAARGTRGRGIEAAGEIDFFIERINASHGRLGLEKIPDGYVRSHMFRRTMSVITSREPDSEIALGLQLKHAARRALANRTTQAYGQMDTKWAKEFDRQLEHAASLRLVELLKARRNGESVAVGPGAARLHAGLDKVIEKMDEDPQLRAQIADERVEAALLASEFPELHFGTINHCMFDAPQAECQNELPADQRGRAPLIGACEPARCRNSVITRAHAPIWIAEEDDLKAMAKEPRMAPPRREAVLIRLDSVERITRALREQGGAV